MQRRWTSSREVILAACLELNRTHCDPPLAPEVEHQVEGAMEMTGGQELPATPSAASESSDGGSGHARRRHRAVRGYLNVTPAESAYLAVALAVAVANELKDDEPLWLILAGASGGGKTEAVSSPSRRSRPASLLFALPIARPRGPPRLEPVVELGGADAQRVPVAAELHGRKQAVTDTTTDCSLGDAEAGGDLLHGQETTRGGSGVQHALPIGSRQSHRPSARDLLREAGTAGGGI